jgi:hypothetical protein
MIDRVMTVSFLGNEDAIFEVRENGDANTFCDNDAIKQLYVGYFRNHPYLHGGSHFG